MMNNVKKLQFQSFGQEKTKTIAKAILADFHRLWKNHIGRSILVALSSNALTPSLNN